MCSREEEEEKGEEEEDNVGSLPYFPYDHKLHLNAKFVRLPATLTTASIAEKGKRKGGGEKKNKERREKPG